MFRKITQIIILACIVAVAAIIQFSFIFALPPFWAANNLLLIILIFALFFYDLRSALGVAFIGGLVLDLFSFHFFGFYILALFLTAWPMEAVLRGWLTNRSLYSFGLLILLATVLYNLLVACLAYFFSAGPSEFFLTEAAFWRSLGYQCLWSGLAALLLFSLAGAATRRLKPFFLEKK
ncbi:MAG: rod shape-determining protein MreD [Patescibacteria group bacterium]